MAYLADQDEELQKSQTAGEAPVASAPQSIGVGSGTIGGGAQNSSAANSPAGGSGWVNLGKYVDTNKDASAGLGDTVAGNVDNRVNNFSTAGTGLKTEAGSEAKAASNDGAASALATGIKTNPVSVNPNDYRSFQSANYGGPKTIQDVQGYGDFTGAYKNANDAVSKINDRDTQGNLLADTYGKDRDYGSGARLLDTSILNADANNQAKLKATADKYTGLGDQYSSINSAINGTLSDAGNQFMKNKDVVTGALTDTRKNLYSNIDSRIDSTSAALRNQAQAEANAQRNALLNSYADRAGIESYLGGNGLVQDSYVTQNGAVGRGNVMSADERARLSALAQLDGSTVEAAQANPFSFDSARFKTDLTKANDAYNAQKAAELAAQQAAAARAAQDKADEAERAKQRQAGRVSITNGNVNIPTQTGGSGDGWGQKGHKYF